MTENIIIPIDNDSSARLYDILPVPENTTDRWHITNVASNGYTSNILNDSRISLIFKNAEARESTQDSSLYVVYDNENLFWGKDKYKITTKEFYKRTANDSGTTHSQKKYGIISLQSSFPSQHYVGELCVLTTNFHEYKWNGTQWVDLGYAGDFPEGYVRLNYIENVSGAYINTGYKPHNNTKIVAKYQLPTLSSGNYYSGYLFGAGDAWDGPPYMPSINIRWMYDKYDGRRQYFENLSYGSSTGITTSIYPVIGSNYWTIKVYDNKVYSNGRLAYTFSNSLGSCPDNLGIFCTIQTNSVDDPIVPDLHDVIPSNFFSSKARLYSFKIYDGDTLVKDFAPAKRQSDGAIGVIDLVNNVFVQSGWSKYSFKSGGEVKKQICDNPPETYPDLPIPSFKFEDVIDVNLTNTAIAYKNKNFGVDFNIIAKSSNYIDSSFNWSDGYPYLTQQDNLGSVALGFMIGDGREDLQRVLNIVCIDDNNNVVLDTSCNINGSYTETPYTLTITPNIGESLSESITATIHFGSECQESVSHTFDVSINSTFENASGYPSLVTESNFDAVNLGYIVGDGFNGGNRTLRVKCKDDLGNIVYDSSFNVPSGSYMENPYTTTIYPSAYLQTGCTKIEIIAYMVFDRFGRTLITDSVSNEFEIDKSFSNYDGYPFLVTDGSLGLITFGYNIGDGYSGGNRILNIVCIDGDGYTLYDSSTYVPQGSYKEDPYVLTINTNSYPDTTSLSIISNMTFNVDNVYLPTTPINHSFVVPAPTFDYTVTQGTDHGKYTGRRNGYDSTYVTVHVNLNTLGGCPTGSKKVNVCVDSSTDRNVHYINQTFDVSGDVFEQDISMSLANSKQMQDVKITSTVRYYGTHGNLLDTEIIIVYSHLQRVS